MKCYLIDLENLEHAMRWARRQKYNFEDRVYVFYSQDLVGIYNSNLEGLKSKCKNVKGIRIENGIHNALDFNLSAMLGMLIQESKDRGYDLLDLYIVSEDKGYEALKDIIVWATSTYGIHIELTFCTLMPGTLPEDIKRKDQQKKFKKLRNKELLFNEVLVNETEATKDLVYRALSGANWSKNNSNQSLRRVFSDKETQRLYRKIIDYVDTNL